MKWKEIRRRAGALLLGAAIFAGSMPMGGYAAEEQVLEELQETSETASDEEMVTVPEEGEAETVITGVETSEESAEPELLKEPEELDVEVETPEESEEPTGTPEELPEYEKEQPLDTELEEEDSVEPEEPDDGQYHFLEGDAASVAAWRDQYLPNGYEDLYALDDTWWENLYDYERDLAEFLKGCVVELSDEIYIDESVEKST